jgi:hypothetical protein
MEPDEVAHYTVQVQMFSSSRTGDDGMPVDLNFKYEEAPRARTSCPRRAPSPRATGW